MYYNKENVINYEFYALVRQLRLRSHYVEKRCVVSTCYRSHCVLTVCLEMASNVLFLLFVTLPVSFANESYRREGFLDRLSSGMKFAHDFLGSESVALKVADFVVRAFNTVNNPTTPLKNQKQPIKDDTEDSEEDIFQQKQPNTNLYQTSNSMSLWRHIIRLLGLQTNQISAVAVNALVFVAQMISTFISGSLRPGKPNRSEDTTAWLLNKNSRKLQDLITAAKNDSLPDIIEDLINEQQSEEETSCIRLLVCKITPFINKMQSTVFGKDDPVSKNNFSDSSGAAILYRHLPTTEEIHNRSDVCERRYKGCNLDE
ncbi:unnamed protein product [Parnassius apollo]|uniref:(apollo) hypothetical protein n=1 Tax=Parnassius apollo TaxID=110799 RepID=A0A8S3X1N4_PARAO|nr:unnamed protein product [Parnassius apollo]